MFRSAGTDSAAVTVVGAPAGTAATGTPSPWVGDRRAPPGPAARPAAERADVVGFGRPRRARGPSREPTDCPPRYRPGSSPHPRHGRIARRVRPGLGRSPGPARRRRPRRRSRPATGPPGIGSTAPGRPAGRTECDMDDMPTRLHVGQPSQVADRQVRHAGLEAQVAGVRRQPLEDGEHRRSVPGLEFGDPQSRQGWRRVVLAGQTTGHEGRSWAQWDWPISVAATPAANLSCTCQVRSAPVLLIESPPSDPSSPGSSQRWRLV